MVHRVAYYLLIAVCGLYLGAFASGIASFDQRLSDLTGADETGIASFYVLGRLMLSLSIFAVLSLALLRQSKDLLLAACIVVGLDFVTKASSVVLFSPIEKMTTNLIISGGVLIIILINLWSWNTQGSKVQRAVSAEGIKTSFSNPSFYPGFIAGVLVAPLMGTALTQSSDVGLLLPIFEGTFAAYWGVKVTAILALMATSALSVQIKAYWPMNLVAFVISMDAGMRVFTLFDGGIKQVLVEGLVLDAAVLVIYVAGYYVAKRHLKAQPAN